MQIPTSVDHPSTDNATEPAAHLAQVDSVNLEDSGPAQLDTDPDATETTKAADTVTETMSNTPTDKVHKATDFR